ncbi:Ig-like domain-containing protein [Actinomadura meyerae]|uniref:Ig-like domain-containing protein n=1 Tax=Actinomadura meyerae TaxID=240840 RepID=A0A239MW49_9ACTN|nr:NBR1-Ig-like domain-containing protein [Actinomadura meyerae]SNT46089.1 Ig-like domain-containing protein [Actinomadura meyerae]
MAEGAGSTPTEEPTEEKRERRERFAADLRDLRAAAGNPAFRTMAGRAGTVSHTTLHEAAKGIRFPSWPTTRAFVEACGGDVEEWRARWSAALGAEEEPGSESASGAEPDARAGADEHRDIVEVPGDGTDRPVRGRPARRHAAVAAVCGGLVIVGAVSWYLMRDDEEVRPRAGAAGVRETPPPSPLVSGDRSTFVRDVTIPDGTSVKAGRRFVKTWEIANSGTARWHGRFLQRADLPADNGTCSTPGKVRVPDTAPGKRVRISVPVVAPSRPGSCWVGWKMVDGRGQQFLPGARPIYFVVNVVE